VSTPGGILVAMSGETETVTAIGTVAVKTPLRAAMSLLAHVVSLAGLYLTLNAHLLAAIQLLVYAGAVVVLFVFVIMLMGPGAMETARDSKGLMVKLLGGSIVVLVAGAIAAQVGHAVGGFPGIEGCAEGQAECGQFGGVDALAHAIYVGAAIPFELVSVLLLVAIVRAIAVPRGQTSLEKKSKGPVITTVDEMYKVGPGPSSSHTIGPMRITYDFYQKCTALPAATRDQATALRVNLFGSLSATGKGHGTNKASTSKASKTKGSKTTGAKGRSAAPGRH